jgi:flagellar biosynthesis/type III secretory pathway protein FliH
MEIFGMNRKIVRNLITHTDETVQIPNAEFPIIEMSSGENNAAVSPKEIQRLQNEDYLKKEYDRIYREAYEAATLQANKDIIEMKDRLMIITNKERDSILEQARNEAIYLNVDAKKGADAIIEQAKNQYTDICKEAYQTGFTQGFNDKTAELEKFVKHVNMTVDTLKVQTNSALRKIESEIEWIAIEIVEKILIAELSKNNKILVDMIKEAIKSVRDADWITIELSEDLKSLSKELQEITTNTDSNTKIEVKVLPNDTKGSVVLQLNDRIMDISVFTQLENIKELFSRGF